MPDDNRLGEAGQTNPNEAMERDGSTQGQGPGTGDAGEGAPADGGAGAATGDQAGATGGAVGTGATPEGDSGR